jgi:AcrR family transcriptional regulator
MKEPRFRRVTSPERRAMLIEAALACLARDGIQGFTVDNICREAKVSRGLIVHHFGSKDALLAAAYAAVYDRLLGVIAPANAEPPGIAELVEVAFSSYFFGPASLKVWLALWGEIASNPVLQAEHRKHYALYRESVARAIGAEARARGRSVDSYEIAVSFIALVDGLWLEQCIDPGLISTSRAREACLGMLNQAIGT